MDRQEERRDELREIKEHDPYPDDIELSNRENEVLQMAASGMTDKEIALQLNVGHGTLRTYWDRTRIKLNAKSRAQAIARLLRRQYTKTEDKLLQDLTRLRLFMMNVTDFGIVMMDQEGTIMTWNAGIERIFGYREDEFIGRPFSILFCKEDQERGLPEEHLRRARDEGPVPEIHRHCRKNGDMFDADGTLFGLWDGEFFGYGKLLREINRGMEIPG